MNLKKITALVLGVVMAAGVFSCCSKEPANSFSETPSVSDAYYEKGLLLSNQIFDDFYLENAKRFMAYVPEYISGNIDSDLSGTASLWAFGAVLTMNSTMLLLDGNYSVLRERAELLVSALEEYRLPRKQRTYSATVGKSEPYYDDNAWVALGMYDLAEATQNDEYFKIAREITDYVLSGESSHGGIFWKESVSSRNTCSSGPCIVAALKEYNHSKDKKYLESAKRIYQWTSEVLCDPADHVYWDNAIYQEGSGTERIEKSKFTYNSGTMIWAGAMLYEITKEQSYLDDATATAEGAYNFFTSKTPSDVTYFPSTPWFNLYLLQGYIALNTISGESKYVEGFRENLDLAWKRGRDKDGYVMPNWGGGPILDEYQYVSILQEAATAECYTLLALQRKENQK